MYPFKFNPILKSTIWGGEKIIPFKGLDINQPQVVDFKIGLNLNGYIRLNF